MSKMWFGWLWEFECGDETVANGVVSEILQGGFPARLKKILIVDAPPWFEFPFRLARPFLTAKMLERVGLHIAYMNRGISTCVALQLYILPSSHLIQHIAIESLPQSLGGRYKHDHQKWLQTCLSRMEGQDKMHSSSHENQGWNNRNGLSMDHEEVSCRFTPLLLARASKRDLFVCGIVRRSSVT